MAQTPLSTDTSYCSASDLFVYHDSNQCADYLRQGNDARPSLLEMLDSTTTVGARLLRFLLAGSGRIEAVCLIGRRYVPLDLQELTGASLEMLKKLNADLSFWQLAQRRNPGTADPKTVPGALEALEMLKALRDGETVFGFEETADAGLPDVIQAIPDRLLTPNTVKRARRVFPRSGPNALDNDGGD